MHARIPAPEDRLFKRSCQCANVDARIAKLLPALLCASPRCSVQAGSSDTSTCCSRARVPVCCRAAAAPSGGDPLVGRAARLGAIRQQTQLSSPSIH
eukprot:6206136-Pleurochrysis_carterae.AAC.2